MLDTESHKIRGQADDEENALDGDTGRRIRGGVVRQTVVLVTRPQFAELNSKFSSKLATRIYRNCFDILMGCIEQSVAFLSML